jgi:curved DNA-binding protein CbpA
MISPTIVPLSGNLKEVSLISLLHFLRNNCKTGILTVNRALFSKSIHFQNGEILFATSNYPNDYLGEVLIRAGRIDFKQYEFVEEQLKSMGKTQTAILMEHGYLKPKDLFEVLLIQMKEIVISLFLWDDASYNFKAMSLSENESIGICIDPDEIIQDGLFRISDWTRLMRLLPPLHFVLKKNQAHGPKHFKVSPDAEWVFNLIDDTRSIRDVLSLSATKALSCAQMLNLLITTETIISALPFSPKMEKEQAVFAGKKQNETKKIPVQEKKDTSWEDASNEVKIKEIREVFATLSSKNYYQILHVNHNADKEVIKRAYFKLVKRYHPDNYQGVALIDVIKDVQAIFIQITRAYDTLSIEATRNAYDHSLKENAIAQPSSEEQLAQAFFSRAATAYANNDLQSAVYLLEESIRLFPESPSKYTVYLRYGQILSRIPGKLREAVEAFHKSATLDLAQSEPHVELGLAYVKTNLTDKAIASFKDALKREPENKTAREELTRLNAKK